MRQQPFKFEKYQPEALASPQPPVEMMREAAAALAESTDGRVEGTVFTANPGGSNIFRHTFYLRARSLNDYTYPLFYVWHDADLYPAHLLLAGDDQKNAQKCKEEDSLHSAIQEILDSSATRKLVRALLAQVDDHSVEGSYR